MQIWELLKLIYFAPDKEGGGGAPEPEKHEGESHEEEDEEVAAPLEDEADESEEADEDGGDDEADYSAEDAKDDEDDEESSAIEEPPVKVLSRSQKRIIQLDRKNKELADQRARDEQELNQLRRQQVQREQTTRQQQEYRQWYESLDEAGRFWEDRRQERLQDQSRMQRLELNIADSNDRSAFQQILSSHPQWRKYEPEVEKILQQARADGINVSRDLILNQVLGTAVRTMKQKPVKAKEAKGRVERETVKPSKGGSNAAGSSRRPAGDSDEALEARLRGVKF